MQQKSGWLTFVLSWVPGVGHLYLGLNKRGLQFMIGFFLFIALIPVMPHVFPFAVAILWFYSLFDALQKAAAINAGNRFDDYGPVPETTANTSRLDQTVDPVKALRDNHVDPVWIGALCIFLGLVLLIRQAFPAVWSFLWRIHMGSIVLALVLIGFGVRLIIIQLKKD